MSNVGGKPNASVDEVQSNSSIRRLPPSTVISKPNKIRCFECEIMFRPKMGEAQQKLCTDCIKGEPRANKPVDHIYGGNFQSTSAQVSQVAAKDPNIKSTNMASAITCLDGTPGIKRLMSSQKPLDNSNKRKRLLEGELYTIFSIQNNVKMASMIYFIST